MKIKLLFILFGLCIIKSSAQCTNVPANSGSAELTYAFSGGSFQSYGCAPIDPTYWIAGNGPSVTVTFSTPQDYPRFRVWGMNTDDVASMMVNNVSYALNTTSAHVFPKVVCGISPGPNGVAFSNGNLMGANTPVEGNYSYNDIQLTTTGVTSFKLTGISGAGWGFVGTVIYCEPLANAEFDWNSAVSIYSKSNELHMDTSAELIDSNVIIYDVLGKEVKNFLLNSTSTIHYLNSGIYLIKIEKNGTVFTKKTIVN